VPENTPLLITAGGFLGRIPFGAFNIGSRQEYEPVLKRRDVAYLRPGRPPAGKRPDHPGLILVNTRPSEQLKNRYPFLQTLDHTFPEGQAVAALNPEARFLSGPAGTKANLSAEWENASFIYLAAHTLRDPQIPYLMLMPLASPAGTSIPEAGYLDFLDVRTADLRTCRLVVLSSCSSGTPYVGTHTDGPSLGDAFIDAGAAAVVYTFWDVPDEDAKEFMTGYARDWGSEGLSQVKALSEACRRVMRAKPGIEAIAKWSAYSIKINGL